MYFIIIHSSNFWDLLSVHIFLYKGTEHGMVYIYMVLRAKKNDKIPIKNL